MELLGKNKARSINPIQASVLKSVITFFMIFLLIIGFVLNESWAKNETLHSAVVPSGNASEACEKLKHCDGSTPQKTIKEGPICILEPGMFNHFNVSDNIHALYACPSESISIFFTGNMNQILEALDNVAQSCTKIKRLFFKGHGLPGSLANGLNRNNIEQLKPYSCLMAEDSTVDINGCNPGEGCSGKLFMQKMADTLFQDKNGTVIAPNTTTYFAYGSTGGVSFAMEAFAYNELRYRPSSSSPLDWNQLSSRGNYRTQIMGEDAREIMVRAGRARQDEHKTLEEACRTSIHQTIENIRHQETVIRNEETCPSFRQCRNPPYNKRINDIVGRLRPSLFDDSLLESIANDYDFLKDWDNKLRQCHDGELQLSSCNNTHRRRFRRGRARVRRGER